MKNRIGWKNNNHTRITELPDADVGMDVHVTADLKCPNHHDLQGIETTLVVSVDLIGYIIRCPACGAEVRLLRSEFELLPRKRPQARRKNVDKL